MATPTSLQDMRNRARELANMETNSGASQFVTDAEVNRHINSGLASLYNLLVGARGEEYYAGSVAIPLVSGTEDYALPADFFQLIGAILFDGSNYYQPTTWSWKETAALKQLASSGGAAAANLRYRVIGRSEPYPAAGFLDRIRVLPSANTGWTLTIEYLPAAPVLTLDPETFDGVSGWEEHACLSAAIKMLAKEETDAGPLLQERGILEQQIARLAGQRNADRPARITDTKGDWSGMAWINGPRGWNA
jgi:hypothetical protein